LASYFDPFSLLRAKYLPVFAMQGALYNPTEEELQSNAQAYVQHVLSAAA
jgi:hypothetical protein